MTKKELRLKYKNLRNALSNDTITNKSLAIANQLILLDIWDKTYFHLFLSIKEQKEVETEIILHLLRGKDKEVIVSKSDFESFKMAHFLLTDTTKLKVNTYGIPEPIDGIEIPINRIEVVFVPLLCYDRVGNRVGYGKGFYDKFLAEYNLNVIKVGLSFFEPESLIDDIHPNDISLDFCVTPNNIYKF